MSYALENAGHHAGWEVLALVRQRVDGHAAPGHRAVTALRVPLAILLHRPGRTRAFALTGEARDPEALAALIRAAR